MPPTHASNATTSISTQVAEESLISAAYPAIPPTYAAEALTSADIIMGSSALKSPLAEAVVLPAIPPTYAVFVVR
jgi:hypothetical protein